MELNFTFIVIICSIYSSPSYFPANAFRKPVLSTGFGVMCKLRFSSRAPAGGGKSRPSPPSWKMEKKNICCMGVFLLLFLLMGMPFSPCEGSFHHVGFFSMSGSFFGHAPPPAKILRAPMISCSLESLARLSTLSQSYLLRTLNIYLCVVLGISC